MTDLLFGLFFLTALISLVSIEKERQKLLFFIIWLLCVVIAGFRGEGVDKDYGTYVSMFFGNLLAGTEPTFIYLSSAIRLICGDDVLFLFFLYGLLGVSIKFFAIRQLTDLWFLSILIYLSSFFALHEITQIRVGVAAGLLLLSVKPLYERNWPLFLIYSVVASLFHYSALVIFLLCFFRGDKINVKFYTLLIVGMYVLHIFNIKLSNMLLLVPIPVLNQKIELYHLITRHEHLQPLNVFGILRLLYTLIAIILLWYHEMIIPHNKYFILLLKIFILSLCMYILFSDIPVLGTRISELLGVVQIILIPMLVYVIRPVFLGKVICIFVGAMVFYFMVFYSGLLQV